MPSVTHCSNQLLNNLKSIWIYSWHILCFFVRLLFNLIDIFAFCYFILLVFLNFFPIFRGNKKLCKTLLWMRGGGKCVYNGCHCHFMSRTLEKLNKWTTSNSSVQHSYFYNNRKSVSERVSEWMKYIYAKYRNSDGISNAKIYNKVHKYMTIWSNKFPVGLPFRWFIFLFFRRGLHCS